MTPAEDGISVEGGDPRDYPGIARSLALRQQRGERAARFDGVAISLDGLVDVRSKFFIDLAIQALSVKYLGNAGE